MDTPVTRPEDEISEYECRAMRELAAGEYGVSVLAFIFETQEPTVRRHIDKDCPHNPYNGRQTPRKRYSDSDLLKAVRLVDRKQPYPSMSQQVYDEYRDETDPAASTIIERFGGWPKARTMALDGEAGSS